jgi:hypothetical protein
MSGIDPQTKKFRRVGALGCSPYSDDQRFNDRGPVGDASRICGEFLPKGTPARIVQKLDAPTAQKIDGLQAGEPKPTQAASPRR